MKQCCVFSYTDAKTAGSHISPLEIIENYGDAFYNPDGTVKHFLHTWDDGERYLARCKKCGALFLVQDSEFHSMSENSEDTYYTDYFQVSSREEAIAYNEKYNGFDIEKYYPGNYLLNINSDWIWSHIGLVSSD